MTKFKNLYQKLPENPGVYLMKNIKGEILYVGKASNLKRRVSSYFLKPQELRIENLLKQIKKIDFIKTKNALEALILEAELIKKYQPLFNIKEKDDKSFLFIEITKEKFPRLLLVRKKDAPQGERFGPFVIAKEVRHALNIIRKIFPYNIHPPQKINCGKACFDYQIGLCPGTCIGKISPQEYKKIIQNIKMILKGKTSNLIRKLEKDMKLFAKKLEFEKAEEIKKQIISLTYLQDIAIIGEKENFFNASLNQRIEGYDISNMMGDYAIGSMVVFLNNKPKKESYRIFKIRTVKKINDLAMLEEVIKRRLKHTEWPYPNLILVDGGKSQVETVKKVLRDKNIFIPVVGIAKGPKRKKNDFYGEMPNFVDKKTLIKIRDEAHRFGIKHHRRLREKEFLKI